MKNTPYLNVWYGISRIFCLRLPKTTIRVVFGTAFYSAYNNPKQKGTTYIFIEKIIDITAWLVD